MADSLHTKLMQIQQELKAPKSERNTFANFDYRSAEKILEAVKPLVHARGLTVYLSDEVENIGESNYIKATATLDDGENRIWVHAYAREEVSKKGMDTAQITGSTSSYARKYALSGLFAIDDTKDADSQDNTNHVSQPAKSYPDGPPKTDKAKAFLNSLKHQIVGTLNTAGLNTANEQKKFISDLISKETIDTIEEAKEILNEAQALVSFEQMEAVDNTNKYEV